MENDSPKSAAADPAPERTPVDLSIQKRAEALATDIMESSLVHSDLTQWLLAYRLAEFTRAVAVPEPAAQQECSCPVKYLTVQGCEHLPTCNSLKREPAPTPSRAEFVEEAVAYLKGMAKLYSRANEHTATCTLNKCAIGIKTALLAEASSLGTKEE